MSGDTLTRPNADFALDRFGEAERMSDHEVVRRVHTEHERGALASDQLRGHTEDRVEQILCPTCAELVHLGPHSRVAARTGAGLTVLPASLLLLRAVCGRTRGGHKVVLPH